MFITGGKEISSEEGITQGDPAAMPFYAVGLVPVQANTNYEKTGSKQVAFADDVNAAGEVKNLRKWWDKVNESGPGHGYYPEASKSHLIVKPEHLEEAKEAFHGTSVKITTSGKNTLVQH